MYIITGGILAMAAVVLLVPKKKSNTENKASSPLDEIDAIVLEKFGPDLTPEVKEMFRQEIAEDLARDKAEERAAWAEFYTERKDWIDNFPFRPGYHPDIVFDPENNIAHSDEKFRAYQKELEKKADAAFEKYDTEVDKLWARTDLTREEKEKADAELYRAVELADQKYHEGDPEIEEQRRVIMRHKQLAGFYAQHYRYRPEFEQAYRIFEEEGAGDNPIQIADTMVALENYFINRRQANQHGLDELHPVQTRWEDPRDRSPNPQKHIHRIALRIRRSQTP